MNRKPKKTTAPATTDIRVRVALPHASSVIASGTFNDWNETGMAFDRDTEGIWFLDLKLAPGRYEYRLIIDGEWSDAPGVTDTVENPFGSRNAVLVVPQDGKRSPK